MFSRDFSKSKIISFLSSKPTEILITESPTPAISLCLEVNCLWVVDAGWIIRDLVSPTLARCDNKLQFSTNFLPASNPDFNENVNLHLGGYFLVMQKLRSR